MENYYKIQLQNNEFFPREGGIVTHAYYLAKELINRGHQLSVLCRNHNNNSTAFEKFETISVMRHRIPNIKGKAWLLDPFLQAMHLRKNIKDYIIEPDLVFSLHFRYAYATKKTFSHKKVIFVIAAVTPLEVISDFNIRNWKSNIYKNIIARQYYYLEKEAIEMADKLVVLSQIKKFEIKEYYGINGKVLNVVPPGVDLDKFKKIEKKQELLEKLNIPFNSKVILTVCRLVQHKNLPMLVRSFSKMKSKNVYLIIVGYGPEFNSLRQLSKELNQQERIKIVGLQENLCDYYSIADLFVLPSVYEGFGLVFLEAMASGIPCIGLRLDYPKVIVASEEIIKDGENGFLINPYSEEELTERIETVLADDKLRDRMGKNARIMCEQKFRWDDHAKKILELGLNGN